VHLPLFWTGLVTPIILLGVLWNASDVLVVASKGDFKHPRLIAAMRRIAYLLILAAIAGTLLVPGLENAILGKPYRLSYQWSLNDLVMCAIGFGLIFFLYKKNQKRE
jgi:thiosulfate reductase cytochrome b subunit